MKTLVDTNVYLHDPKIRRKMLVHNARESSIFEGASCLHANKAAKFTVAAKAKNGKVHVVRSKARKRLSKAATKKATKGS